MLLLPALNTNIFTIKPLKIGEFTAKTPIVQGGMGVGISLAGLASAVAEQGGIGVISSAGFDARQDFGVALPNSSKIPKRPNLLTKFA